MSSNATTESLVSTTEPTLNEYVQGWLKRIQGGDFGSLPIIAGLIIIAVIFGTLEPVFFNSRNFVNLLLQMSGTLTIAIGVVFVLLIAEIDLSIAYVSGVGGVLMTLLLRVDGPQWPWWAAIGTALLATTLIGLLHGFIITKARVPSFVVTLAGLLAWSGVVLIMTTEFTTSGTPSRADHQRHHRRRARRAGVAVDGARAEPNCESCFAPLARG